MPAKYPSLFLITVMLLGLNINTYSAYPIKTTSTKQLQLTNKTGSFGTHSNFRHALNYGPVERRTGNGKLALVLGIISLVTIFWLGGILFGIPAVALGASGMKKDGDPDARTGFICGIISLGITVLAIILFLFFLGLFGF